MVFIGSCRNVYARQLYIPFFWAERIFVVFGLFLDGQLFIVVEK